MTPGSQLAASGSAWRVADLQCHRIRTSMVLLRRDSSSCDQLMVLTATNLKSKRRKITHRLYPPAPPPSPQLLRKPATAWNAVTPRCRPSQRTLRGRLVDLARVIENGLNVILPCAGARALAADIQCLLDIEAEAPRSRTHFRLVRLKRLPDPAPRCFAESPPATRTSIQVGRLDTCWNSSYRSLSPCAVSHSA